MSRMFVVLLDRPQVLSASQLEKVAEIFINIGTLFFGSSVVPYFINVDRPPLYVLSLGVGFSIISWIFSVNLVKDI